MPTPAFPKWGVLRYALAATSLGLACVACRPQQSTVTGPDSRAPNFSQSGTRLGEGFVSIDYPGAIFTTLQSITSSGTILGRYLDEDGHLHGFRLSKSTFTMVPDLQGAIESAPNRLNAQGTIVGTYRNEDNSEHAYVLSRGTVTKIDFPDPSISLTGWGISSRGDVVGVKFVEGDFLSGHGYRFSHDAFTLFDVPDATGTFPTAIASNGSIVGTYLDDSGFHGFLFAGGQFSTIDFPNSTYDWVNDISSRGETVGTYWDQAGVPHGFVYSSGAFKSLDPPGSTSTQSLGINAQGDVVGTYVSADGTYHGFFLACATCSLR